MASRTNPSRIVLRGCVPVHCFGNILGNFKIFSGSAEAVAPTSGDFLNLEKQIWSDVSNFFVGTERRMRCRQWKECDHTSCRECCHNE